MSILIKGMEMPKDCVHCRFHSITLRDLLWCEVAMAHRRNFKDCPLVELPPHGRLIDADVLKKVIKDEADFIEANCGEDEHSFKIGSLGAFARAGGCIREAPTIIEAENPTQCNSSNTKESWTQIVCKCGGKRFIAQGDIVVCDKCGAKMESEE